MFGLNLEIYKPEIRFIRGKDGKYIQKTIVGRCTNCHKPIQIGSLILTQKYRTRFGSGIHKFCTMCSATGVKELVKATEHLELRAKTGFDYY